MTDYSQIQPYSPQPIEVPAGMTVGYTAQGQPVYLPAAGAQAPIVVQMPTAPVPAWIRNGLLVAVGLLILCTPATVLLVVAAPAIAAMGQAIAYGGIGIGIGVIGVAAAIKELRVTPRAPRRVKKAK